MVLPPEVVHPAGEVEIPPKQALSTAVEVETYAGKVHQECWRLIVTKSMEVFMGQDPPKALPLAT